MLNNISSFAVKFKGNDFQEYYNLEDEKKLTFVDSDVLPIAQYRCLYHSIHFQWNLNKNASWNWKSDVSLVVGNLQLYQLALQQWSPMGAWHEAKTEIFSTYDMLKLQEYTIQLVHTLSKWFQVLNQQLLSQFQNLQQDEMTISFEKFQSQLTVLKIITYIQISITRFLGVLFEINILN